MKSTMQNMALSLTLIAAAMGALLAYVHSITAEPIAQAEAKARRQALAAVLPAQAQACGSTPVEILAPGDSRPVALYPAGQAAAVESWTMDGFSGEILVMVGFDADGKVSGYQVLQQAETPGLGAKAGEWFKSEAQAQGSTGATSKGRRSIIGTSHALALTKDQGEIDGITAATITSRAFLDAVNRARSAYELWRQQQSE